jgi:Rieske Fe-S protein
MATEPTRRTVLQAAGAVGAAAASAGTLAACGSGTASNVASQVAGAASQAADAVKKADIPVGGGKVIGKVVVTQPSAGTFKAFSAVCTHQGCTVSKVENSKIICSCHNSVFDAATGAVVSGPASSPLPAKSVTVSGDGISVS